MEEPLPLPPMTTTTCARRRRRLGMCHQSGVPLPASLRLLQDLAKPVTTARSPSTAIATAVTSLQRRNAFRKTSAPVRVAAEANGKIVPSTAAILLFLDGDQRVSLRRRQRRSSATTERLSSSSFIFDDESLSSPCRPDQAVGRMPITRMQRNSSTGSSSIISLRKDSKQRRRHMEMRKSQETITMKTPLDGSGIARRRVSYPVGPRPGIRHCWRWRRRSTSAAATFWIRPSRHRVKANKTKFQT